MEPGLLYVLIAAILMMIWICAVIADLFGAKVPPILLPPFYDYVPKFALILGALCVVYFIADFFFDVPFYDHFPMGKGQSNG